MNLSTKNDTDKQCVKLARKLASHLNFTLRYRKGILTLNQGFGWTEYSIEDAIIMLVDKLVDDRLDTDPEVKSDIIEASFSLEHYNCPRYQYLPLQWVDLDDEEGPKALNIFKCLLSSKCYLATKGDLIEVRKSSNIWRRVYEN